MKDYGPRRTYSSEYTLVVPKEKVLRFNSRFEAGNLKRAIKVSDYEYHLFLEYDVETKGHVQWFYFSVTNYRERQPVTFKIVNFMKPESLYNYGMKPLVFSTKSKEKGWHRDGSAVTYYRNSIPRSSLNSSIKQHYYTLNFTFTFEHKEDTVYFAHCYPYTYSDLMNHLDSYAQNEKYSSFLRVNTLCKTLGGNELPVLTITENIQSYTPWEKEFEKVQKSASGRKIMRQRENRQKGKMKVLEKIKNIKLVQGKVNIDRKRTQRQKRSNSKCTSPPRRVQLFLHDAGRY